MLGFYEYERWSLDNLRREWKRLDREHARLTAERDRLAERPGHHQVRLEQLAGILASLGDSLYEIRQAGRAANGEH